MAERVCAVCGIPIEEVSKRKTRQFCGDAHRVQWHRWKRKQTDTRVHNIDCIWQLVEHDLNTPQKRNFMSEEFTRYIDELQEAIRVLEQLGTK